MYLTSTAISCDVLLNSRWLGSIDASAQVVEIVVKSTFGTGLDTVSKGAEINYAKGGRSSAYEQSAASGSVNFTLNTPGGPAAGGVVASYASPAGDLSGHFHAEFCDGGQGY